MSWVKVEQGGRMLWTDEHDEDMPTMFEVADIFGRFAAGYLDVHGAAVPPSYRRAIRDILDCRNVALGG